MTTELHESIASTRVEATVKESAGYRLRMVRHEVLTPKGLYSIDLVNESLKADGSVAYTSTYNFFMDKDELQKLAYVLTNPL